MTKNISNRIYYLANKLKAVNYLGGKCIKCGESENSKLCFHHLDPKVKDSKLNKFFLYRWDKIQKELDKCELLCMNCHMETHYGEKNRNEKKILLEFKGQLSCEMCDYDKCNAALEFHHLDPKKKEFKMSSVMHIKYENLQTLKENIEEELNKCQVLCSNCHKHLHSDDFLEKNKSIILDKMDNKKHKREDLDRDKVKEMFNNGMKQIDIARYFKASKGTISIIIKKLQIH